jgi:hypothetical protein
MDHISRDLSGTTWPSRTFLKFSKKKDPKIPRQDIANSAALAASKLVPLLYKKKYTQKAIPTSTGGTI